MTQSKSTHNIVVLGAGLIGLPMALDLARIDGFDVSLCDVRQEVLDEIRLKYGLKVVQADLSSKEALENSIKDADIVVSAVPGFMGYKTLKRIIEAGKPVVDIAFSPEDLFELDQLARQKEIIVISDIGVAPGMSNILIGHAQSQLDKIDKLRIYVGGLPKARTWPWEYKAVFSPVDVIEEYTRTARFIRNGVYTEMPALSEPELIDFPEVGTLEAFNSDGLRSLMKTIECPDMIEKTLRYPGHIDKIRVLRDSGFFSKNDIMINGQPVKPIDLTSRLLFESWHLKDEKDITVMKILIEGTKDERRIRYTWDLFDEFDNQTGVHSMARTTGYTATGAVRIIAKGLFKKTGVNPPEYLGQDPECVRLMLDHLHERGVIYRTNVETL